MAVPVTIHFVCLKSSHNSNIPTRFGVIVRVRMIPVRDKFRFLCATGGICNDTQA